MADEPPTKKIKLDEAASPPLAPVAPPSPSPFSFVGESGLFGSLVDTLGKRASNEPEVGITEYVDPDIPPFSGIIKHRFTDFLVYEVGMDGDVVRLKNIKAPPKPPKPVVEATDEPVAPVETSLWNDRSETAAKLFISPGKLEDFKTFVLAGPAPVDRNRGATPAPPPLSFTTDAIEAKDDRTALHRGLREAFNSKMFSETREVTPGGDQVIDILWQTAGSRKPRISKAQKKSQEGDLPNYIHFTLQKSNKEMHDALAGLCRSLGLQNRDIGTAGTKDKRAITVQRVSIKRGKRTLEDVWRAANPGGRGGRGRGRGRGGFSGGAGDRGVRIGDLAYSTEFLELGKLKGNKFVVTLRDVKADSPTTIDRAISVLRDRGFLNYYGMQRFGTAPIPTHAVGLALLRSDWALASHLLLVERDGEGDDAKLARILWKEGKFEDAVRTMPRRCVAERAIMEHYSHAGDKKDHLSALSRIPKNLRMMYVHGYQSYVWNRVVSARVQLFGCSTPVVGDLVYEDGEGPVGEDGEGVEHKVEEEKLESLDPDLEDDTLSLSAPAKGEMTSEKAERASKVPKAKVLMQADIDSGKYSIKDVILPMPGFAVIYPTGKLGEMYREILKSDKLDLDDMFRKQKEYSLGGTYRTLLHTPTDVTHRLLLYTSPSQDLAQSDEDVLLGLPAPPTLPFTGVVPEGHHLALQIELTLGAGTFATMALREVLKTRTGSAHQKDLTREMEERLRGEGEGTMEVDVKAEGEVVAAV